MNNDQILFTFPCSYPVKIMGLNNAIFTAAVMSIFQRHVPDEQFICSSQLSKSNKYLSITVTFTAESKEQLDALYQELNDHELVLMTL